MVAGEEKRLAVLMTCHNRVDSTVECLKALKQQKSFGASLDIILADDGSNDGTAQSVLEIFPQATVIRGDGNLYWCGGMRVAFEQAIKGNYDYYLWLNDDTHLDDDALLRMFQTYADASSQLGEATITVGSTCDRISGLMTYGGWIERTGKLGSTSWEKTSPPIQHWVRCDAMNGNCVLIPSAVTKKIGGLDNSFTHSMGDLDYGLRAKKSGCQIVIAPGYFGECKANEGKGLWTDSSLPTWTRWKKLLGPKGLPFKEWGVFCRRHKGALWPLVWMSPYINFWVRVCLTSERKVA